MATVIPLVFLTENLQHLAQNIIGPSYLWSEMNEFGMGVCSESMPSPCLYGRGPGGCIMCWERKLLPSFWMLLEF